MRAGIWYLVFGIWMMLMLTGCSECQAADPVIYTQINLEDNGQELTYVVVDASGYIIGASVDECRWTGLLVTNWFDLFQGVRPIVMLEGRAFELGYRVTSMVDVTDQWMGGGSW